MPDPSDPQARRAGELRPAHAHTPQTTSERPRIPLSEFCLQRGVPGTITVPVRMDEKQAHMKAHENSGGIATHFDGLCKHLGDISRLLEVHALVSTRVNGRSTALQVLNRSAVVLLAACWEAYIEDLAVSSFDWLLSQCNEPTSFPAKVRARATSVLREDKNELAVWALAGGGWRVVLEKHRDAAVAGTNAKPKV